MLPKELIQKINHLFDFRDKIGVIRKVDKGYLSDNYIVGNKKERLFLKKYRSFGIDRLKEVQAVKQFYTEREIPVILPLQNKNGKTFFKWRGNFYSLFPFVDGIQFERLKLSKKALVSCGRLLANIHLQSKNGHPGLVKERYFGWNRKDFLKKIKIIQNILLRKRKKIEFDKKVEKFISQKIFIAEKNPITYESLSLRSGHLIHGDYHEENMFFDSKGEIKFLFDWEKANTSPRAMEVARALEFLCFYGKHKDSNYRKAEIFLKEYNQKYPLLKEELKKAITAWYLSQVHGLWILEEHYLKNNFRIDNLLENHIEFIDYYSKNLKNHLVKVCSGF
jgi:homoserine kinase type II